VTDERLYKTEEINAVRTALRLRFGREETNCSRCERSEEMDWFPEMFRCALDGKLYAEVDVCPEYVPKEEDEV